MSSDDSTSLLKDIDQRAEVIRRELIFAQCARIDRLFALLLAIQFLVGVIIATQLSPYTWQGLSRHLNPHIGWAVGFGGIVAALPIFLAWVEPGRFTTRLVIGVAQMLHSALLIHLCGGRLETHFHIFGSLAFLSFYRDWRVLVPATLTVAADHAFRGLFWPESVFGVLSASPWRWVEHAGWVAFEDVFLIWAGLRGSSELMLLAMRQAELETINRRVELEVSQKTSQLESVTQELLATARLAGMAEVATGVLHNVGNVLNSVNVCANVIAEKVQQAPVANLARATAMIEDHQENLAAFLTADQRGRQIPKYLSMVSKILTEENAAVQQEILTLTKGIEHIKQIVRMQQDHATSSTFLSPVEPASLLDDAARMIALSLDRHGVTVVREAADVGIVEIDKHKTLQILINLISNAKNAVRDAGKAISPKVIMRLSAFEKSGRRWLRYDVIDNGVGISAENLSRVFSHGFTTRASGHGFGLHSAALAAREMGGSLTVSSEGVGKGATFSLQIPVQSTEAKVA